MLEAAFLEEVLFLVEVAFFELVTGFLTLLLVCLVEVLIFLVEVDEGLGIVAEIGCPAEWADAMAEASPAPAPGMPAKPVETDFLVLLLLLLFFVLELAFLVEEEAAGIVAATG